MNCASTSCQTATALPGPSLVALTRSQRVSGPRLHNLLPTLSSFLRLLAGWCAQRLETPAARPLTSLHELSDHVLRDIGYLDSMPLREDTRRTNDY
ncbi:MAG: hypothetical protein ABI171_03465 [Collimonas sp.]|uniref:hypothetical protein n=1 Tax=Collimonas sp. TaxID=1963772 RepID=UPI0032653268